MYLQYEYINKLTCVTSWCKKIILRMLKSCKVFDEFTSNLYTYWHKILDWLLFVLVTFKLHNECASQFKYVRFQLSLIYSNIFLQIN